MLKIFGPPELKAYEDGFGGAPVFRFPIWLPLVGGLDLWFGFAVSEI